MLLQGTDGQTVILRIVNYQFPQDEKGDWDSNWLNIYIQVVSLQGHWQTVDPSLTTWEVQELIDWLRVLATDTAPEYSTLSFTEPNLSFALLNLSTDPVKMLRLYLAAESRPQSAKGDRVYYVDIPADNDELRRLADALSEELARYPERKPGAH